MSAPHRKVAALALAAGLGLSLAACTDKGEGSAAGDRVTITVDCQPVGAQADLLRDWNADVDAFQKIHTNITIKSVSVGAQCNNPPDFTARLQGGTVTDVFYGYMTDLQQVIDSGQAMEITQYVNKDTVPTWDSIDAGAKAAFTDNGAVYGDPDQELLDGPGLQQEPVPAGRSRREEPAEDLARGPGGRQEDLGTRQRHRRVLRVQRRQHRWLALHRLAVRPGRSDGHPGRQDGRLQQRDGPAGPAEPEGHAVRRQQHG